MENEKRAEHTLIESLESHFEALQDDFKKITNDYKRKTKRLDRIIKQSDKQQLQVLKLNEELDSYKNHLEEKVREKTKELEELNASLEQRVKEEVEANREKDKQLNEQAKFAQIGELMSNIAHHWRQPLNTISTAASGIQTMRELGMSDPDDENKAIVKIIDATKFLSGVIKDFAEFVNDNKNEEVSSFAMQDVVNKSLNILVSSLEMNNIKVVKQLPPNNLTVRSISTKVANSLLNVLKNAQDALLRVEDDREKKITIRLVEKPNSVVVAIKDNADGIPEDILPKIFDPYFTTKHQSTGTGLGLFRVREDIEQHLKGAIRVNNSPNGAEFLIIIPKKIK